MNLFEDLGLSSEMLTAIKGMGITKPTQIQGKSIPHIIQGRDVVGESATGSGKTLAFGCGIIEQSVPGAGIQALILAPTRELAEQVRGALNILSGTKQLKIISVYGGVSINPQIDDLKRADVVVATPGRLLDHLERRTIDLSKVKILVLDEADRMLDMGFIDDVEKIIRQCPRKRQTLFFSATISTEIRRLSERYMESPSQVTATRMVDPAKLTQIYYDVQGNEKLSLIAHLLKQDSTGLAMIFCNTRRTTEFVSKNLRANQVKATSIHGGMTQNKRSNTIEMFNKGKIRILVCTDVAARGLHIENVSHVYNYDLPKDPKDYVHRIGRTARAGEEGIVVNLLANQDHDNFSRILNEYRDYKIQKTEKPEFPKTKTIRDDRSRGRGGFGRFRGQGNRRFSRGSPRGSSGSFGGSRGSSRGNSGGSSRGSSGWGARPGSSSRGRSGGGQRWGVRPSGKGRARR